MDYKKDLRLSTAVEAANHPVWGKPYANGTIKAFFVPSTHFEREIAELLQRTDVDHENVTIDKISSLNVWGFGDFYGKRGSIGDAAELFKRLEEVLTSEEEFDVLVIPGIGGWGQFSDKTREAIIRRVENGTGLIMVQPFNGKAYDHVDAIDKLSPLKPLYRGGVTDTEDRNSELDKLGKDKWLAEKHYITAGIPFELIPFGELGYFPYEANGEVIIRSESGKPVAAVKEYGKGRIVAFGYYARDILPQHNEYIGWDPCYEPIVANWHGASYSTPFNHLEYFYSLINRSMIWAAGKEPDCTIISTAAGSDSIGVKLSKPGSHTLSYKIKNLYDEVVLEGESNTASIALPAWLKLGGDFRVEVFLKENGKILDWSTAAVSYPKQAWIESLSVCCSVVKPGDKLTGTATFAGTAARLEMQIIDDYDRVITLQKQDISGSGSAEIIYTAEESKSMHIRVQASVYINDHLIHRVISGRVIVTPQDRDFHDFEAFICPQNRGHGDLNAIENKQLIDMGDTGLFYGDNKLSTLSGAEGLGLPWYSRAPYVEAKEKYIKTRDKKYLHRINCLNSPEFWKENEERIDVTVGSNAKYGPVSYFANDEGSLTCYTDDLDLCFCPSCMNGMREWLKSEYKSLDELNSVWVTNFNKWEEVEPYTEAEARKTRDYASWGDHRRFMNMSFANAYGHIRDSIRKIDPLGKVRMSGTQQPTPYSGYDYYLLHQVIGYFEAYGGGNQFELHRSYVNPGTVLGRWVGYGASGVSASNGVWLGVYHGLTLMSVFWEYSCLNPDFTYSRSAIDYGRVFKEIKREGIGKLLLYTAKRDSLGIALHQSMTSINGSYLRGNVNRYDKDRQGWINLLEDMGYQYDIMASQQLEGGKLTNSGYKLLILPYAISLSEKEVSEIKKFTENGGVVLGDFQTGLMDVHCKLYDNGNLDNVFGIERYSTEMQPFYIDNELRSTKNFPYFDNYNVYGSPDFAFAESGTRAGSGRAAYVHDFSGTIPAIVVNDYGKGKGVYLNFALDSYPELRQANKGKDMRVLLNRVLKLAGIHKFASLQSFDGEAIENGYETIYYSDNEAEYVGILRDIGGSVRIGADGLAVGNVQGVGTSKDTVGVQLRRKAHIYDVREKKYLGFTDKVQAGILPGDTVLLALLPFKVESIDLTVDTRVSRGADLNLTFKVNSDKPENAYANVCSISFYNPQGEYEWIYSDNVSINGKSGGRSYQIPFNEKTGKWKAVVKDVASGISAEEYFEIK